MTSFGRFIVIVSLSRNISTLFDLPFAYYSKIAYFVAYNDRKQLKLHLYEREV